MIYVSAHASLNNHLSSLSSCCCCCCLLSPQPWLVKSRAQELVLLAVAATIAGSSRTAAAAPHGRSYTPAAAALTRLLLPLAPAAVSPFATLLPCYCSCPTATAVTRSPHVLHTLWPTTTAAAEPAAHLLPSKSFCCHYMGLVLTTPTSSPHHCCCPYLGLAFMV